MRKYWKTGCNWRGSNTSYYDLMKKHSIVVCCDSHDMKDLDIGDVVAIAHGFDIFALAEVTGEKHPVTEFAELRSDFGEAGIEYEDSVYVANCKIIELDDSEHIEYRAQQGILQIKKMNVKKKIDHYIEEKFKPMNSKKNLNEYVQLLKSNHNLILTGAPGTGKTYIAKEIAKGMGCTDDEIGFVQFHPSYDYTDFVEGLRPKQDDNGNVVFERKDGEFKKFCKKAIAKETTEENKFDEIWDKFIADIRVKLSNGELTKIGNWEYGLSTKDSLKYSSINTPSQYSFTITKKNILDTYCGRQARPSGAFQKDMLDIVQHLKQTYNLSDKPEQTDSGDKTTKQYVFIIDEINRGEISKIFGELFFSIDPGYRGTDGKVKTQYQNLIEEDDEFFLD